MDTTSERVSNGTHNAINDKNALDSQIEITTTTTRLWVTSSWYLRWRWIAKNLSTLMATTPKNDAVENDNTIMWKALYVLHPILLRRIILTRSEM